MPDDWYSPALDFLGSAAWPAAFLLAIWLFRGPIGKFIDEVTQFEGFGTKATRSGNRLTKSLKQDALEDLGSVEESDGPADDEPPEGAQVAGADEAGANVTGPAPAQRYAQPPPGQFDGDDVPQDQILQFLGDQIYQKLLNTKRQADTKSSAASAELVRSAYSDLRLGVRFLGQHRLGIDKISGTSWPFASADTILRRLGAPQEQVDLTRQIRRLEEQVRSKSVRVDGSGAGDFVQTAIEIHIAIYSWAGIDVRATRRRKLPTQAN